MKRKTEVKVNNPDTQQIAMRVSGVSIGVNLLLSVMKLAAGILASSSAMVSDAIHSASDVFSTIIVMIGVRISGKQADREHPYGHERFECVAAVILAVVLAVTGFGIGESGIKKIVSGEYQNLTAPGLLALAAAAISIGTKEWMYHYTVHAAKKINSGALRADAWHHRSDALSSVGALAGILFARMGYPIMDSVASVVICLFILKAAYDVFMDAVNKMIDRACDEETEERMRDIILTTENVLGISRMKTRLFGAKMYLDVEIEVEGGLPLVEAHGIAQIVHDRIEKIFPQVKHCMVHVNPAECLVCEETNE